MPRIPARCGSAATTARRSSRSSRWIKLRFPGAAQHEVVRCRPGIVTNSEYTNAELATAPDQQCTASRCTASGEQEQVSLPIRLRPQLETLNLTRRGFRQLGAEFEPARIFVGGEFLLAV